MTILLRIIGIFWTLFTAKIILSLFNRILHSGIDVHFSLGDFIYVLLFAGGIGLIVLKEWARWAVLIGCAALLLLRLDLHHLSLKPIIFYGIFIVLLMLPQSRSATSK